MLFSIIIPVYNAEPFLKVCVDSVLMQDFYDYEILLINDGSLDGCHEICRDYAEHWENVRYVRQDNAGPSAARNRGLDLARGTYLMFLDADDSLEDGSLKLLARILKEAQPDAVISSEKVRNSPQAEPVTEILTLDSTRIHAGKTEALTELSEKRFCLLTHKIVVRRSIVEENHLHFRAEYRVGEDILMMVQTLCKCNSFYLNQTPYYIYNNYNASSIMRTLRFDRMWQTTAICTDLYAQAKTAAEPERKLLLTASSMLMINFTQAYGTFTGEQKRKLRRWMKENRHILAPAADMHITTRLTGKILGPGKAFLLAGFAVSRINAGR